MSVATLLAGAGCGTEQSPESSPTTESAEARTLAEFEVPLVESGAPYRFSFLVVDDVVVTLMDSPAGHPAPTLPDECALHTFLRVAADDVVVPPELLADCAVEPGEGPMTSGALRASDPVLASMSLRSLDLTAPASRCAKPTTDQRAQELEALAAYQPPTLACENDCTLRAVWDTTSCAVGGGNCGCVFTDGNGQFLYSCSQLDLQSLVSQFGPTGNRCMKSDQECKVVPNASCAHPSWVYSDSHYTSWSRAHLNITRARVEIENCSNEPTIGRWRQRKSGEAWGPFHAFTGVANGKRTLILSAGWSDGRWRGRDFHVRAEGGDLSVASAWVRMTGLPKDTCPLKI